jgi:hypothetical protein
MGKKLMIVCLTIVMVMGGISGIITPGGGKAFAAVSFVGGAGTVDDPYQIATADQLDEVKNHLDVGVYFKLTADIDLVGYNWQPIGADSNNGFKGNVEGNGFKIKNLTIDRTTTDNVGLFGLASNSVCLTI